MEGNNIHNACSGTPPARHNPGAGLGASVCIQIRKAPTGAITRCFNGYVDQIIARLFHFLPFFLFTLAFLLGRTVYVAQHQTFGMALNRLDQILRTNHVRRELMEGRFFIKGHVRRHKLNAIRWRRRFAQTVGSRNQVTECL